MIRKFFTLVAVALIYLNSAAQLHCYTTEVYKQLVKENPEVLQQQSALEQFTGNFIQNKASFRTDGQVYIIPLVFHIIHNYGPENISDEQIIDQVRILNLDYRKLNTDTGDVIRAFKPIAADCGIEFRLANLDPYGNCTSGIDRIPSALTVNAADNAKLNPWPANKYLNIWVVNSIIAVDAAAYSYYPGTAPPGKDGVLIRYNYIGSIGSGDPIVARTLTHEIGHCLNLKHPWGDTNAPGVACGDDQVTDTPPTKGWDHCDLAGATCGNTVDNVQNYMEYSFCNNMFTKGQKDRMIACLTYTMSPFRNNLWSTGNLTATGVNHTVPNPCKPVAEFTVDHLFVCPGSQVQYTDLSWNGQPTAWKWSFPGGNPASSTDSTPAILYPSSGNYAVTLTVSNSKGIDSVTKNAIIHVYGANLAAPYSQDFENAANFPGWESYILNPDNGPTWWRTTNAAASGSASVYVNNFNNWPGQVDTYILPALDLRYTTRTALTFKVAYAQRNSSSNDMLRVYISTNCGASWSMRYSKSGAALATAPKDSSDFKPKSTQWRQDSIPLSIYSGKTNIRIKFENTSDNGNNIYLDDINLTGVVGIAEANAEVDGLEIYPNPSRGESNLHFELMKACDTKISVLDITGRKVSDITSQRLTAGVHNYSINTSQLSKGIYFVQLLIDGQPLVRKMLVD